MKRTILLVAAVALSTVGAAMLYLRDAVFYSGRTGSDEVHYYRNPAALAFAGDIMTLTGVALFWRAVRH